MRPAAPLLLLVLPLLLVGCFCGSGCAMSRSAYDSLEAEVQERNGFRREAALERFRADGYEWAEDVALVAVLDDVGTDRCRAARDEGTSAASPEGDSARVRVRVVAPNPAGGPSTPRAELEVLVETACEFFSGRGERLSGFDTEGTPTDFVRATLPMARDPSGELVWVELVHDVISDRTVLVEESCNEMPNPGPAPFERPPDPVGVVPPPAPTRKVRLEVEYEELDYECTDIVQ